MSGGLLLTTRIVTFELQRQLTNTTGFFLEHDERAVLVGSRPVLIDPPTGSLPNRIEIELHRLYPLVDSTGFSSLHKRLIGDRM